MEDVVDEASAEVKVDAAFNRACGDVLGVELALDADDLRQGSSADFDTLLDVLSEASARWAEDNVAFWAFLELPGGGEEAAGDDEEE